MIFFSFLEVFLSLEKKLIFLSFFFFSFSSLVPKQVCIPLPPYATRSGPRKTIYADPATTTAAIVTCGGLCPGELLEGEKEAKKREESLGVENGKKRFWFLFSFGEKKLTSLSSLLFSKTQTQASTTSSRTSSSPSRTTACPLIRSSGSGTASAASTRPAAAPSAAAGSRSSCRERPSRGST